MFQWRAAFKVTMRGTIDYEDDHDDAVMTSLKP